MGVRRTRPDEASRGIDQRSVDQGRGPAIPVGRTGTAAGGCAGTGWRAVLSAPRRKHPAASDAREHVLSQLGEVFRAHGYEGASLTLITEATGLGKGSLYNLFPRGKQ